MPGRRCVTLSLKDPDITEIGGPITKDEAEDSYIHIYEALLQYRHIPFPTRNALAKSTASAFPVKLA